jgi:hypothetical protein
MNVTQWAAAAIVSTGAALLVDSLFRLASAPTAARYAAGAVLLVVLLVVALALDRGGRSTSRSPR